MEVGPDEEAMEPTVEGAEVGFAGMGAESLLE